MKSPINQIFTFLTVFCNIGRSGCYTRGLCCRISRLEKWAGASLMKFTKGKRKILHQYSRHRQKIRADVLESDFAEKDLVVQMDIKVNMSQHSACKASGIMGCIKKGVVERLSTVTLALSTGEATSGLLCPMLGPPALLQNGDTGQSPEVHPERKETLFNV